MHTLHYNIYKTIFDAWSDTEKQWTAGLHQILNLLLPSSSCDAEQTGTGQKQTKYNSANKKCCEMLYRMSGTKR